MIFKYLQLKDFFLEMKKHSNVIPLNQWKGQKAIILRHDVDFDVKAAYNLAVIENELNIKSTFFFMTSNFNYNIFSEKNRELLNKISDMGFEIGLHFDPKIYEGKNLEEMADFEAKILSSVIDKKIESLSLHNPSIYGEFPIFEKYNNAYNKEIFSDKNYLSDSCMDFRGKNPFEFIKSAKFKTLQVLLHPLHYSEKGDNYLEISSRIITDFINLHDTVAKPNKTYAELLQGKSLLEYFKNEK